MSMQNDTDAFELKRMMRQEAHEKAFEFQVMGQRSFEHERELNFQKGAKKNLKEFNEKMDKLQVDQKIATSAKNNDVRIKKMKCRDDQLVLLRDETKARIISDLNAESDGYKEVCKNLIIQGMIRLLEENVVLKVREGEQDMVADLLEECQDQYAQHMLDNTGREYATKLTIMQDKFLNKEEGSEFGGVMLYAHRGRIVVANTLLDRMNLVFEVALPDIRAMLFPENKISKK